MSGATTNTNAAADLIPVSLEDWMRSACDLQSMDTYVESAVNLAWMLTKRICQLMAAPSDEVRLENQLVAENILIFMERSSLILQSIQRSHSILDVKFQFEVLGRNAHQKSSGISASQCPHAVCVALGKLLLQIFSRGQSNSLEVSNGAAGKNGSECTKNNTRTISQAGKKIKTVHYTSDSASESANNILLGLGMPLSICQFVRDLLRAGQEPRPNLALTSVKQAFWDLTQMKINRSFLFDRTSPQKALDDTGLFGKEDEHFSGREKEMRVLTSLKNKVAAHASATDSASTQCSSFQCETVFLGGYPGTGKTSLLQVLIDACSKEQWFVLSCKFEKHSAPHTILAQAFNDFFGKWGTTNTAVNNPAMLQSFNSVCRSIISAVDDEGFGQLCDIVPNFASLFPLLTRSRSNSRDEDCITSMDKVGSATRRHNNLFNVMFKSLCSAGRPVLLAPDDLQWSACFGGLKFLDVHDKLGVSGVTPRQGLLVAGTYRSNEADESSDLMRRINQFKQSRLANVTMLSIDELSEADTTKLISARLCLPWRYVQDLAAVVHSKTANGNTFFVIQFLRSIIQNKMLEFSVEKRRFVWDCDIIDLQMISDDVAKLLASTFNKLDSALMKTVKIMSCLGHQVEESTIKLLNFGEEVLPFDMIHELNRAVKELILEKAGPVFQFTHDIIQSAVYDLIPLAHRKLLHRTIGDALLKSAADNPTIHLLAVEQINIYCTDCDVGDLSPEERAKYAECNTMAAKVVLATSTFEQAQSFISVGIKLLDYQHWKKQYKLSLDLYEMSASVACMRGDIRTMSSSIDEILSHAKTFDDSLNASSLLVRLLSSQSKFNDATSNCLTILSNLGEVFPLDLSLPLVRSELSKTKTLLQNVRQIKLLPRMTNRNKLNSMKILNGLGKVCKHSKPMLLPLIACRLVTLTMDFGFCGDESIYGLALIGFCIYLYTEEYEVAKRIGKIADALIQESPRRHILRCQCFESTSWKLFAEPCQSVASTFPNQCHSAMLAGDVESAMLIRLVSAQTSFFFGDSLDSASKQFVSLLRDAAEYQMQSYMHSPMAFLGTISHLSGRGCATSGVKVKSFSELDRIAEETNNKWLSWQSFYGQLSVLFWMRQFNDLIELSQKYGPLQGKRPGEVNRIFYDGIAYLNLARDTRQPKWRGLGEKAVAKISQLESLSKWNFENSSKLLQAELHYVDGDLQSAEANYRASIKSAREHKFRSEEALAHELYGIFCVENNMADKGIEQLHTAVDMYTEWGGTRKANEVQLYISRISQQHQKS